MSLSCCSPMGWNHQLKCILRKNSRDRTAEEIEAIATTLKPVFTNNVTTDALKNYVDAASLEVHEARTILCLQEESIDKFYYILRGQVTLYSDCTSTSIDSTLPSTATNTSTGTKSMKQGGARRRLRNYGIEIDVLFPGQFFGEYSCMSLSENKSPVTIVTSEYTELLTISKSSFQSILLKHFTFQLLDKASFLCTNYNMIRFLDISRLSHLCRVTREKTFRYNEIITRQCSLINNVYLIKSGLLKLSFNKKKLDIDGIRSKIHPPVGLLAQILKSDFIRANSAGVAGNSAPGTTSNRNKKTSRPRRKSVVDFHAEREQTLRRYGYREINLLKETLLCVLTNGGVVGGIEALGGLRQNLFTVTVDSSTATVYQINVAHFNSLFSVSCPEQVVEEVLQRLLEHIRHWKERFEDTKIDLFDVLVQLFDQKLQELEMSRLMQDTGGSGAGTTVGSDGDQLVRPRPHNYRRPENLPRLIKDYICR